MNQSDQRGREIAGLRERLSRLSQASLRINESLDLDTVLQGGLDSARSLTAARHWPHPDVHPCGLCLLPIIGAGSRLGDCSPVRWSASIGSAPKFLLPRQRPEGYCSGIARVRKPGGHSVSWALTLKE